MTVMTAEVKSCQNWTTDLKPGDELVFPARRVLSCPRLDPDLSEFLVRGAGRVYLFSRRLFRNGEVQMRLIGRDSAAAFYISEALLRDLACFVPAPRLGYAGRRVQSLLTGETLRVARVGATGFSAEDGGPGSLVFRWRDIGATWDWA